MGDDLGNKPGRDRKGMNKVIEADFLPRGTNADFSWPRSISGSGVKERRRILIGEVSIFKGIHFLHPLAFLS
jgi:hypothetical protein